MRYLSQSKADIDAMLQAVGVDSIDALFEQIPKAARPKQPLALPPPASEQNILSELNKLAGRNANVPTFCGAGLHSHYIPAAVDTLSLRGEFATAYTPYQPEVSQGTLQSIFEFQTIVSELLGLPYANASMYDGASALAEAVLMARRLTKRSQCAVLPGLHPEYLDTVRTYLGAVDNGDPQCAIIGQSNDDQRPGGVDHPTADPSLSMNMRIDAAIDALRDDMACVVIQAPSFFGEIYDWSKLADAAREKGILCIAVCTEPLALALCKTPGEMGADIAVAEGMGLASAPTYGGPGVGLFALRDKKMLRQMPGRVAGQTIDRDGRRGYVLTLSTREQHIRREKATSNICTNHGLIALRLTIHLSLLGRLGFIELAKRNIAKRAHFVRSFDAAKQTSSQSTGSTPPGSTTIVPHIAFGEILIKANSTNQSRDPNWDTFTEHCVHEHNMIPGVPLGRFDSTWNDYLLVSVSDMHSDEDIETLARQIAVGNTGADGEIS